MPRKSVHVEQKDTADRDELATYLQKSLNDRQKDGRKVAYFLDEKEDPSNVAEWISTGSTLLDLAICNRPSCGLPVGRISEINGLESCVTEDTEIEVIIDQSPTKKIIKIGEVKKLLESGKNVRVKTLNGDFIKITKYIEKGLLDTYKVLLQNGKTIKVSKDHRFFTDVGWLETKNLRPKETTILCDDGKYYVVESIDFIGKSYIVDVSVDHPEHCYFGNGILNHNSGKSLLCAHIIAETQKRGGFAAMLDPEVAAAPEFWTAVGVNIKNLVHMPCEHLEEMLDLLERTVGECRKEYPDRLVTIVVDSIASVPTKKELEDGYEVAGYGGDKSKILSLAMRIF